ncbi:uncharacterized protein LOC126410238 [Nymphaea colorata]|nr:uncharacterized protein LOC126410238 [Nymphaea colorata]
MSHHLLWSVKNRFGSTDEFGVFEMSQSGLQAASNPSEIFLSEKNCNSEVLAGLAISVIIDGSRIFLLEVQAIFLNVVSGMKLTETAGDLAIAAAICSGFLEFLIPKNVGFIGEVEKLVLVASFERVARMDKRLNELIKLRNLRSALFQKWQRSRSKPLTKCVIPKVAEKSFKAIDTSGITTVTCSNLKEVLNKVFRTD